MFRHQVGQHTIALLQACARTEEYWVNIAGIYSRRTLHGINKAMLQTNTPGRLFFVLYIGALHLLYPFIIHFLRHFPVMQFSKRNIRRFHFIIRFFYG